MGLTQSRKHGNRMLIAVLAGVLLASALPATGALAATTEAGTVTGALLDRAGGPATGVTVTLTFKGGDSATPVTTTSGNDGTYTLTSVPVGGYNATTAGAGYDRAALGFVTVSANATTTIPTATLTKNPTVRGTVTSADGAPIQGATVTASSASARSSSDPHITTAADGSFVLSGDQANFGVLFVSKRGWNQTAPVYINPRYGETITLGSPIALDPVGYADFTLRSRTGHTIGAKYIQFLTDGCNEQQQAAAVGACGVVAKSASGYNSFSYKSQDFVMTPGAHTFRFTVSNPLNDTVRHITRHITIDGGDAYTMSTNTLQFKVDPMTRAKVATTSFRRNHPVTIRVALPRYTDNSVPKLETTLVINGKRFTAQKQSYAIGQSGKKQVRITVPAARTDAKQLRVRAVLHGTKAHAGARSSTAAISR